MSGRRGVKRERIEEQSNDGFQPSLSPADHSPNQKRGKFERSFVPSWLDRFDWLVYDSSRNLMYCGLCRKYRKNNAFTEGCQNFRRDNLNKHMATNDHKFCVDQDAAICKVATHMEEATRSSVHAPAQQLQIPTPSTSTTSQPSERASSPMTPGGRRSDSSSRSSSGVFSNTSSNSLPQSPASMPLPSPPAFAPSRTPSSTVHHPVPLHLYPPPLFPASYMPPDVRYANFHGNES